MFESTYVHTAYSSEILSVCGHEFATVLICLGRNWVMCLCALSTIANDDDNGVWRVYFNVCRTCTTVEVSRRVSSTSKRGLPYDVCPSLSFYTISSCLFRSIIYFSPAPWTSTSNIPRNCHFASYTQARVRGSWCQIVQALDLLRACLEKQNNRNQTPRSTPLPIPSCFSIKYYATTKKLNSLVDCNVPDDWSRSYRCVHKHS